MRLLVLGAMGFLGQRIVAHALERGHHVLAVVRPGRDVSSMSWAGNAGVRLLEIDLGSESSANDLAASLGGVDAVIHAAGVLSGNDAVHRLETIEPTRNLVRAMRQTGRRRLVLISSLSVYGYAALPEGAQLDETTPTEHDLTDRDAYCRAKLAQEAIAVEAAQLHGMRVTSLRPGVIYGPGRLWSARLGLTAGPLGLLLGGQALIPLTYVEHSAAAAVLAAETDVAASDVFVKCNGAGEDGAFEAINVIDDDLPTQRQYADLLRKHAGNSPKVFLRLPWGLLRKIAAAVGLLGMLVPGMVSRLPQIFRPASMHARIKPLRYSNCRLHDRLGWQPFTDTRKAVMASGKAG